MYPQIGKRLRKTNDRSNSLVMPGANASDGPRVTRLFRLMSYGGDLDCSQFDKMRDSGHFPPVEDGFKTDDNYEGYYCSALSGSGRSGPPPVGLFMAFLCVWLIFLRG